MMPEPHAVIASSVKPPVASGVPLDRVRPARDAGTATILPPHSPRPSTATATGHILPPRPLAPRIEEDAPTISLPSAATVDNDAVRPRIQLPSPPQPAHSPPASHPAVAPSVPPSPPTPQAVDRSIRPRRFAILIIFLLLLFAAVGATAWFLIRSWKGTATPSSSQNAAVVAPSPAVSAVPFDQTDTDSDGLTDAQEQDLGTDISNPDSDGDRYTDKQELDAGYDPLGLGMLDTDRDGLPDPVEHCWGTDVNNPDTDGDGYLDGQEVVNGYGPKVASPNDKDTTPPACAASFPVRSWHPDAK